MVRISIKLSLQCLILLSVGSEITATFPGLPVLPSGDGALAARLVRIWRLRLAKFSTPRRASTGNPESSPKPAWISELTLSWHGGRTARHTERKGGNSWAILYKAIISADPFAAMGAGKGSEER